MSHPYGEEHCGAWAGIVLAASGLGIILAALAALVRILIR